MVRDDAEMDTLTESIREYGILTPLIVRPMEEKQNEYEVISGHRRLHAAQLAGCVTIPALIHPVDRDAAAIAVVDSNLHREHILPSEKAFAYKLKMDALRHQGKTSRQIGEKWSVEQVSDAADDSARQIHRYIRLTKLVPSLLRMVDENRIAFSVAVELSFLCQDTQNHLAEIIERDEMTPSYSQAVRMHREDACDMIPGISNERVDAIMAEEKPNQKEQIRLRRDEFSKYFPAGYSERQIRADIIAGLDLLKRQRERSRERDER
jgi:ParB family chromosome partitioning protein